MRITWKARASGVTIWEIAVALGVLAVLALLAWPAVQSSLVRDGFPSVISNMKQLHLATQQMALDGEATTNRSIGWPGDTGGRFETWASNLVSGNYLATNDLWKLLSAPGRVTPLGAIPQANTNALLVYAVREDSPGEAVFLTSANFTNTPSGGVAPLAGSLPYGTKGLALIRKAGDGALLQPRQAGHTNTVGAYVPLCR